MHLNQPINLSPALPAARRRAHLLVCSALSLLTLPYSIHGQTLTATIETPVVITDPLSLTPGTQIVFGESGAVVHLQIPATQSILSHLAPLTGGATGTVLLDADTSANLDFSGLGNVTVSALSLTTWSGRWTPDGSTYTVGLAWHDRWANTHRQLTLSAVDALSDGTGARSLAVGEGASLVLAASNSYSGGTTVTAGSRLTATASGALGSGTVVLNGRGGSAPELVVYGLAGQPAEITNQLTIGAQGGSVRLVDGANYAGNISVTGPGKLEISSSSSAYAEFSGALTLAANSGFTVSIGDGSLVSASIAITAGNSLQLRQNGTGPALFSDLTLAADATVRDTGVYFSTLEGVPYHTAPSLLALGGSASAFLNNAWFDASSLVLQAGQEDAVWDLLTGNSWLILSTENGTIDGSLRAMNVPDGLQIDFLSNETNTQLWMSVSSAAAIPEPSTYAALAGVVALAGAALRKRLTRLRAAKIF